MRFQEKLHAYSKEEIWEEYCGFLNLTSEEFMNIQNRLLLDLCVKELKKHKFEVLLHRLVPPNDGGIALGQAMAAAFKINTEE